MTCLCIKLQLILFQGIFYLHFWRFLTFKIGVITIILERSTNTIHQIYLNLPLLLAEIQSMISLKPNKKFKKMFFYHTNFTLHRSLICGRKFLKTISWKNVLTMKFWLKRLHGTCFAQVTFKCYLFTLTPQKIANHLRIMRKQKNYPYL